MFKDVVIGLAFRNKYYSNSYLSVWYLLHLYIEPPLNADRPCQLSWRSQIWCGSSTNKRNVRQVYAFVQARLSFCCSILREVSYSHVLAHLWCVRFTELL